MPDTPKPRDPRPILAFLFIGYSGGIIRVRQSLTCLPPLANDFEVLKVLSAALDAIPPGITPDSVLFLAAPLTDEEISRRIRSSGSAPLGKYPDVIGHSPLHIRKRKKRRKRSRKHGNTH